MQIEDLGLSIGTPLQIQTLDEAENKYTVHLIGYARGRGLIVSADKTGGTEIAMVLKDDQPLIIRLLTSSNAAAFRTHIMEKRLTPYPLLHLAMPKEIESVKVTPNSMVYLERNVTLINDDEDSHSAQTTLTGISLTEARIEDTARLASEGQRVTITLSFGFCGKLNVIVLEGQVARVTESDAGGQELIVAYRELDQSDKILLHAYVYERMLVNHKLLSDD